MQVEHHELHHEFPEFLDVMQVLRNSDSHFSEMFDEYHALTNQVEHLEEEDVPVDDFTIEDMKKKRVKLKDSMYKMLVAHTSSH
ncbi:MAG: hypothetical protein RJA63_3340 [Pseudomonadota bacterium]|jgi:uncharacterized protein YdcH (DUF465 family)|uniref:YdcH family protein n=1 Tax=Propionivibrio sp. TaxID=2212460 RepID=UPI001B7BB4DC|nr:DUF465 domain-containing protein [Propionivibrio sp.]MBP7204711.1 DUF465 domain-containing protein [Propionivibrio sp.]